ncbi:hypothetical protein QM012_002176 [Aureobasidium pullulans]|uniref:Uncharacterized protein n=1 Tax=Aureobasidium pullulans TaxID=5580 RepID=A0ABR0TCM3_AURPU
MADENSRIGLYCGLVALALSSIMIIGIAANTDPEQRRLQELEARDHYAGPHAARIEALRRVVAVADEVHEARCKLH